MSSFCQIVREVSNNISDIKVIMCVREVMRKDGVRGRITVLFVSKEKIRELNRRYRGIDAPTDTLSFPFFDDFNSKQNAKNRLYLGEIAVCLEELTITKSKDEVWEALHVITHGTFHLIGRHHEHSEEELGKIHKEEVNIIERVLRF